MRGISPAIATIFLIGVAVVGAIAAGNAMFTQNEISQKTTRAEIIDAILVKMTPDKTYFEATIKNSGTTTFATINVSFADDSGIFHTIASPGPLNPGEQFADHLIEDVSVNPDKRYLLDVEGTTTSGSTFHSAQLIIVRD